LEINPRAIAFAGFNIMANGMENVIQLKEGNEDDVFMPVRWEKFGYIISDPPFEPVPSGLDYYVHSSGGEYGLDFVEQILRRLDGFLEEDTHAQIVSFSPGDLNGPFMLINTALRYLNGRIRIVVNPVAMLFNDFMERFTEIAGLPQMESIKRKAEEEGISHLYLCMFHYEKGDFSLEINPSIKTYKNWDIPLESDVPMGCKKAHPCRTTRVVVDDDIESYLMTQGPRFSLRDGISEGRFGHERMKRLGRFIGIFGTEDEAKEAVQHLNRHHLRRSTNPAYYIRITKMGKWNYRIPAPGEAAEFIVVDP
jgi:hypothetical protein